MITVCTSLRLNLHAADSNVGLPTAVTSEPDLMTSQTVPDRFTVEAAVADSKTATEQRSSDRLHCSPS